MSHEWFDAAWKIAAFIFAAGGMWAELRAIRKDLSRLEEKQDKYNNLQERVARVESSCKEAHHRISELHFGHRSE